jgi:hypothetical protein
MSDDLVKRLRDESDNPMQDTAYTRLNELMREAADAIESLRRDAGRYRLLRQASFGDGPAVFDDDDCNTWLIGDALDASVDAAIEARKA